MADNVCMAIPSEAKPVYWSLYKVVSSLEQTASITHNSTKASQSISVIQPHIYKAFMTGPQLPIDWFYGMISTVHSREVGGS